MSHLLLTDTETSSISTTSTCQVYWFYPKPSYTYTVICPSVIVSLCGMDFLMTDPKRKTRHILGFKEKMMKV